VRRQCIDNNESRRGGRRSRSEVTEEMATALLPRRPLPKRLWLLLATESSMSIGFGQMNE
jgi:hypothetical protein